MKRPVLILAISVLVLVAAFSLLLATRHPVQGASSTPSPLLGQVAPAVTGGALATNPSTGVAISGTGNLLSSLRGKIVVLNFWSSWCGPCKEEAPNLSTFAWQERNSNVDVVGVLFNDNVSSAESFAKYYGSLYSTVVDTGGVDANRYGVTSPPTTFIINAQGRVAAELIGPTTAAQLRGAVAKVGA